MFTKAQLLVIARGTAIAAISAVVAVVYQIADEFIATQEFPTITKDFMLTTGKAALVAAVGYILNKVRTGNVEPAQKMLEAAAEDKQLAARK